MVVGTDTSACAYCFTCPSCGDPVSRTAVPDVIELLLSAGVRRERFAHPSMLPAPTPFTERDVHDFRSLLSSPDWFTSLQAKVDEE